MALSQLSHSHACLNQLVFWQLTAEGYISDGRNGEFKIRTTRVNVVPIKTNYFKQF